MGLNRKNKINLGAAMASLCAASVLSTTAMAKFNPFQPTRTAVVSPFVGPMRPLSTSPLSSFVGPVRPAATLAPSTQPTTTDPATGETGTGGSLNITSGGTDPISGPTSPQRPPNRDPFRPPLRSPFTP